MRKEKVIAMCLSVALLLPSGVILAETSSKNSVGTVSHKDMNHHKAGFKHGFISEELLALLKTDRNSLMKELKSGKSLADLASEKGIPKEQVVDLLVKQSNEKLDSAVAEGKLTKEQALLIKPNIKEKIVQHVEVKGIYTKKHRRGGHHLNEAAEILGMTKEEVIAGLKSGKSLADIAKEKGIDEDKLVNALVAKEKERINVWVKKKWGKN